jgi:adenylosuccinate lyase
LLLEDSEVMACLNQNDIAAIFRIENFLKHTDFIFKRVFG